MAEKHSIFQEVSEDKTKAPEPKGGLIDAAKTEARAAIRVWLSILLMLVAAMIVLGGLTRLTDSGLSITEWNVIKGALPPMNDAAWQTAFEKYQEIPEYQLQNKGMDLAGFKSIYWWEWSHRQLGRLISLVWALGFFWFLFRQKIPTGWTGKLALLGGLGGLQGAIGWWMVSSGLTGRLVDVASYRLAIHLGLAFFIMGLIVWYLISLKTGAQEMLQARRNREHGLTRLANLLLGLIFLQILLGALVAGIDAGRGYIDWPLMAGQFLPDESFDYVPLWSNFFENPALVQFNHRMLGYLVFLMAIFIWWKSRSSAIRATKSKFDLLAAIIILQVVLGISTVLYAAPVGIAIVHQIGAIFVLAIALQARFAAMYPPSQSIRG